MLLCCRVAPTALKGGLQLLGPLAAKMHFIHAERPITLDARILYPRTTTSKEGMLRLHPSTPLPLLLAAAAARALLPRRRRRRRLHAVLAALAALATAAAAARGQGDVLEDIFAAVEREAVLVHLLQRAIAHRTLAAQGRGRVRCGKLQQVAGVARTCSTVHGAGGCRILTSQQVAAWVTAGFGSFMPWQQACKHPHLMSYTAPL